MSSSAYFITFTFADPFLPKDLSVSVEFHQKFMKRLRKEFGNDIRFMMCGEYGERFGRPHYHYCLFNIDLSDKFTLSVETALSIICLLVLLRYGTTVIIIFLTLLLSLLLMSPVM